MKLTAVQKEILVHLRDGGRIIRREGTCQRVYEFKSDKDHRIILAKTVDQMMELGLLYVDVPPEGGSTTHLITIRGRAAILKKPTAEEVDEAFYRWEIAQHEGHHHAHVQEYAQEFDVLVEAYLRDMPEVLKRLNDEVKERKRLKRLLRKWKH